MPQNFDRIWTNISRPNPSVYTDRFPEFQIPFHWKNNTLIIKEPYAKKSLDGSYNIRIDNPPIYAPKYDNLALKAMIRMAKHNTNTIEF